MSDSGGQIGDCQHGNDKRYCIFCLTEENAYLKESQSLTGEAMWQALDALKMHIGGFDNWPLALKEAFSKAIIDRRPPSPAEMARILELSRKYGWK